MIMRMYLLSLDVIGRGPKMSGATRLNVASTLYASGTSHSYMFLEPSDFRAAQA